MTGHEIEVKLLIPQLSTALERLAAAGAGVHSPRLFEDNFLLDDQSHTLRHQRQLLRIRVLKPVPEAGSETVILTFKGVPEIVEGMKKREEIEGTFSNGTELLVIFSRLGFNITFRYQKYRTQYLLPQLPLTICVDETPIGNYYELEGDVETIHECAKKLGYTREHYIAESYASLYLRWCRENGHTPAHMLFEE